MRLADVVLLDTDAHIQYFRERIGARRTRYERVLVGADDEIMRPRPRREDGSFRALFYSSYIPLHGAEYMVRAAHVLERAGEPVDLLIVGAGQTHGDARRLAERLQLRSVQFVADRLAYDELPSLIGDSDVCLGVFGTTSKAARVIPNKVYDGLATARTVVTADTPAAREVLTDGVDCRLCPPGDPAALAAVLAGAAGAARGRRCAGVRRARALPPRVLARCSERTCRTPVRGARPWVSSAILRRWASQRAVSGRVRRGGGARGRPAGADGVEVIGRRGRDDRGAHRRRDPRHAPPGGHAGRGGHVDARSGGTRRSYRWAASTSARSTSRSHSSSCRCCSTGQRPTGLPEGSKYIVGILAMLGLSTVYIALNSSGDFAAAFPHGCASSRPRHDLADRGLGQVTKRDFTLIMRVFIVAVWPRSPSHSSVRGTAPSTGAPRPSADPTCSASFAGTLVVAGLHTSVLLQPGVPHRGRAHGHRRPRAHPARSLRSWPPASPSSSGVWAPGPSHRGPRLRRDAGLRTVESHRRRRRPRVHGPERAPSGRPPGLQGVRLQLHGDPAQRRLRRHRDVPGPPRVRRGVAARAPSTA